MKGDLCFLGPDPGLTCKLTLQRGPLGCACEWAPSCWGMKCLPVCVLSRFSCVQLFSTLWTVARQDPLSMGFSKQEYWSGLPCPPLGDLPDPGIEPLSLESPAWRVDSLPLCHLRSPCKDLDQVKCKNTTGCVRGVAKQDLLFIYYLLFVWLP